jgi:NADH-quinone oxidoreductase subunit L
MVFLGEPGEHTAREGSPVMVISVAVLAVLSLAGGLFIAWPSQFVLAAIENLPGIIK